MKESELHEAIVQLLAGKTDAPMSASDIATSLELKGKLRKHLQKTLGELIRGGRIVLVRGNRYALGKPADLVTGDLQVARSGNGYLTPVEGGPDVFIPSAELGTALPGDRVVVRLNREGGRGDRPEGKVLRVVDRQRRHVVGTLKTTGQFLYVVPIDPGYAKDFYVRDAGGANIEDRVVVRFTGWANRHVNPEGEIIEVLGPADRPDVDTLSAIRHHHLADVFPPDVVHEAETVAAMLDEPGERMDLRERLILTIDPERARDFDDALSMERDADGQRVLGVHIADVAHFVTLGSPLDLEARSRGNSVYLPDKVLPMLPEQLSNGVCSLRPGVDRLAFSAFITFDDQSRMVARRFAKSVIRSRYRLTYEQAMALLDGKPDPGPGKAAFSTGIEQDGITLLRELDTLAQELRARRYANHALELDVPECEIVLDADGRMIDVRATVNDRSHQLVEECMVAANEAVAVELSNRHVPLISRVHDEPDEMKLEDLTAELVSMGYTPGNIQNRRNLAAFLRSVSGDPLEYHVRIAVLRSMKRAQYAADASGHFGLAKAFYAHFTSPIRRYADLTVHRQLAAVLAGDKPPYRTGTLTSIARECSDREFAAERAERDVIEMKKYRFLKDQIETQQPGTYAAVVVKVTNFGLFVDVPELQVSGLIHVSAISNRFVRYSRGSEHLRAGSRTYKLGDRLKVYPVSVDFDARRIDFGLYSAGK